MDKRFKGNINCKLHSQETYSLFDYMNNNNLIIRKVLILIEMYYSEDTLIAASCSTF